LTQGGSGQRHRGGVAVETQGKRLVAATVQAQQDGDSKTP